MLFAANRGLDLNFMILNVFLTNDKGSLRADKVHYDFETKYYQISMFSDKKVKIKLIKWAILKKNLGS